MSEGFWIDVNGGMFPLLESGVGDNIILATLTIT